MPREAVNYAEAHDNETMWDKIMMAALASATLAQRVRHADPRSGARARQGMPFFHVGGELLRTKSMDTDSYDWRLFNRVDWTLTTNHWGGPRRGQEQGPLADDEVAARARTDLTPGRAELALSSGAFADFLRVRRSTPFFRLRTADDVNARVKFMNTGPMQIPGLIVMTLADGVNGCRSARRGSACSCSSTRTRAK